MPLVLVLVLARGILNALSWPVKHGRFVRATTRSSQGQPASAAMRHDTIPARASFAPYAGVGRWGWLPEPVVESGATTAFQGTCIALRYLVSPLCALSIYPFDGEGSQ